MTTYALDANIVIFLVEGRSHIVAAAQADIFVTSTLALTETLVVPIRDNDENDIAAFRTFFSAGDVRLIEVDRTIAERAASLRATLKLKLADSVHLATAIAAGAAVFLTTDERFAKCIGRVPIEIRILIP